MILRLKEIREKHDLKQRQIADKLNISKSTYNYFETGERIITPKHLNNFCNTFSVSADFVLGLSNNNIVTKDLPKINQKLIGERIAKIRKDNNWTQQELAQLFNTSQSTVSAYENGKTLILTAFIYAMCKEFNISADYLLGRSNIINIIL